MATIDGTQLSQTIQAKTAEMIRLCEGLDDETASRSPSGRWTPKQIITHISGPDGIGFMPAIRRILEQDTPRIDIVAEDPFFTERRAQMPMKELIAEFVQEYAKIAGFLEHASEEQLVRKAHIPLFKDTPLGEHPTLAAFISALAGWHLDFHINHMKEVLQTLKKT
jgi:hypothetical protein